MKLEAITRLYSYPAQRCQLTLLKIPVLSQKFKSQEAKQFLKPGFSLKIYISVTKKNVMVCTVLIREMLILNRKDQIPNNIISYLNNN